jgi:hypothetical protein
MIEAILSCDCDSECTDPNSHLRLLTRKGGRDHSAIDRRPLPRITFGGTSSGRALCPRAEGSAGSDGCKPTVLRAPDGVKGERKDVRHRREALCRPKIGSCVSRPVVRQSSILTSEPHRPQRRTPRKGRNWDARCDVWPALAPFTIDPAKALVPLDALEGLSAGWVLPGQAMPGPAVSRRRSG